MENMMNDINYYLVRAIDNSQQCLDNFIDNNVVAVGWSDVNFLNYKHVDEIFDNLEYLNDIAPQVAGRHRGQIIRFLNIKKNDRVVVPYWNSICLATVTGKRNYNNNTYNLDQSNEISVQYLRNNSNELIFIPRDSLSEGLQRRIRVRGMTVNDLNEFSDEIEKYFNKGITDKLSYSWIEGLEDIQKNILDDFKSKLLENIQNGYTNLKAGGIGLEQLVNELIEIEGYKANILAKKTFPSHADADIEAIKADKFSETKLLIQVKHHSGVSGLKGVEQLIEIKNSLPEMYNNHKMIFVTSADVSQEVVEKSESNDIAVITGTELVSWITDSIKYLKYDTKMRLGIIEIPQIYSSK